MGIVRENKYNYPTAFSCVEILYSLFAFIWFLIKSFCFTIKCLYYIVTINNVVIVSIGQKKMASTLSLHVTRGGAEVKKNDSFHIVSLYYI